MTYFADVWTVDNLSSTLESQPSVVRRHLGFWVSQGVLKEESPDVFAVVERLQEGTRTLPQGMCVHVICVTILRFEVYCNCCGHKSISQLFL